ncbi:hypothetical protein D9619_005026 [Psilocybe cf. subviscida]|uniref:Uncharacterized protein n=1 Tax=Psilocybe cf. subviscida TaxID=2480587 RepID=A0A8H5F8H2_9AGAR|nr:hypothetical protein D9619_005026 [Psilocybe cf. subviscida]
MSLWLTRTRLAHNAYLFIPVERGPHILKPLVTPLYSHIMEFNNALRDNITYCDTTQTSTGPWPKRNLVVEPTCTIIDSDISSELHCYPSKKRRLTVSYASYSTYSRQNPCRKRGLSLLTRPGQPSSFEAASPPAHTPTLAALNSMTQKACILDLPIELLSQILISGASSDWLYCLDYGLFRAFRDAHPHLRRSALIELMRLYPQILDYELTASGGSGPSTPTQENAQSPTWKSHLQEAIMNPMSRSTWNLTRYDPIHPAYFFNAAPTPLPIKDNNST